ncbi:hypothetical protein EAH87_16030 [Sphingomonas koreensis]|nr:hypothetical protein EAH87_16030 [Sphingomonas koreensis]
MALAGCSSHQQPATDDDPTGAGARLEAAAIATGVVADPDSSDLTGVYTRDTDSICIVPAATDFRIGLGMDYGAGQQCTGQGSVTRDGATLHIAIGDGGCRFDGRFDGDRIALPGSLPAACDALCSGRASLAGMAVDRLSNSLSEAETLRGPKGQALCGG